MLTLLFYIQRLNMFRLEEEVISQGSLTFWTAAFPGLARNLPEVKESALQVAAGKKRCFASSSVMQLD